MTIDEEKRILKAARKDTVAIIVAMIGNSVFYAVYSSIRGSFNLDNLINVVTISIVTSLLAAFMFYRFRIAIKAESK